MADFQNEYIDEKSNIPEDCIYILGLAVYDIFSNNHEVISAQNRIYDLGSMRGSGSFIGDFLNDFYPHLHLAYDYMDFYMGSTIINNRADIAPFYEYIFAKLKERDCLWKYIFPRLYLADLSHLKQEEETAPEAYDPQQAVLKEIEEKEKNEEIEKLQQRIEDIHQQELEEARLKPPPLLVQAYKNVYGEFPEGFPP